MRIRSLLLSSVALAICFAAPTASAQHHHHGGYQNNNQIEDLSPAYLATQLKECLKQRNFTELSGEIASPGSSIGNLLYWAKPITGGAPTVQHVAVFNDVRVAQPEHAADPLCFVNVEATIDGSLSLAGIPVIQAHQGDVYHVEYRAIQTQSLNRNSDGTSLFSGAAHRIQVGDVVTHSVNRALVDEAWGVTEITVWTVTVQRFHSSSASLNASIQFAAGGVTYAHDTTFHENYMVITGEEEPILLSQYSPTVAIDQAAAQQAAYAAEAQRAAAAAAAAHATAASVPSTTTSTTTSTLPPPPPPPPPPVVRSGHPFV